MNKEEEFKLQDDIYQYTEPFVNSTEFARVWIRDIWDHLNIDQMMELQNKAKLHKNIKIGVNLHHIADMEKRITTLESKIDLLTKRMSIQNDL